MRTPSPGTLMRQDIVSPDLGILSIFGTQKLSYNLRQRRNAGCIPELIVNKRKRRRPALPSKRLHTDSHLIYRRTRENLVGLEITFAPQFSYLFLDFLRLQGLYIQSRRSLTYTVDRQFRIQPAPVVRINSPIGKGITLFL